MTMWEPILVCRNRTLKYSWAMRHLVCDLLSSSLRGKFFIVPSQAFCKFESKICLKIIDNFTLL